MLRPYATYRDLVRLLRRDLHRDLPRLVLLRPPPPSNRRAGPGGLSLVNLTSGPFKLALPPVSFADFGVAPIFPSHDALHHRRTAPPGRARAGEAVLRRAGTERGRLRGEA